jgi:hypothetical protein
VAIAQPVVHRPEANAYTRTRRGLHGVREMLIAGPLAGLGAAAGGVPAYGNIRSGWDAGCRYDFANPEYR